MTIAAETVVTQPRKFCVPRGPNAVVLAPPPKSAAASAFPGCNNTEIIKITHAKR
jgi:hypothetical protein